ncbi:hypothetical protein PLESTB_001104800 [Pleodorina starrii]|uniref:Helicase C-terminal domain-containing protein n=1 Tax=Pleodorina starrii TaxID=330485 RepID=A0A9W6BQR1_9CHLO|nr:hypothetical protein PLESTM_001339900 [Pleodorina starrii]GLC56438.1 hypothetical protein PLESTB_001104800 [Pleodorina starrii]GLC68939.1 hypothetical protein PLESTF_000761100 [Pleodorina starrii]
MSFPSKLRCRLLDLQHVVLGIVDDLAQNQTALSGFDELERIVFDRPDLLPAILKYAKNLVADYTHEAAGPAGAGPANAGDAVPAGQDVPAEQARRDAADRLPPPAGVVEADVEAADGSGYKGEDGQAPGPFRVYRRPLGDGAASATDPAAVASPALVGAAAASSQPGCGAAGGQRLDPTAADASRRQAPAENAAAPNTVAPAEAAATMDWTSCGATSSRRYGAEGADVDAGTEAGASLLAQGLMDLEMRGLLPASEPTHIVERELRLADLQRPFSRMEAADLEALEEAADPVEAAAAAAAGAAAEDVAAATPAAAVAAPAAVADQAAAAAPARAPDLAAAAASATAASPAEAAAATAATTPVPAAATPAASATTAAAATPAAAATTAAAATPTAAATLAAAATPTAPAAPSAAPAAAAGVAAVAGQAAAPRSPGACETPRASHPVDEDALMDEPEYHTPRSFDDDQEPLATSPARRQRPEPEPQSGPLPEVQPEPQQQPEALSDQVAEEDAEEESEEESEDQGDEDAWYCFGHPAHGMCTNWPGAARRIDREEWETEFKHRTRVQREGGGYRYQLGHKNTRREVLKYFLQNTDGPISADGPGGGDEGADGGAGGFFVAAAAKKADAGAGAAGGGGPGGFADDGLDADQEEFDDKAYLDEISRREEDDEQDDEFVSDDSADGDELEGADDEAAAAAVATGPADADEEEDLDATAALDSPPPRAPRSRPAADVEGAGAAGAADGGGGRAEGRRKAAPVRRVVAPGGGAAADEGRAGGIAIGVGFSSSVLPSGVRSMLRELATTGAIGNNPMSKITTRYTHATLERLMAVLSQEVARIKTEWQASKARLKLEARAVYWRRLAHTAVKSALDAAATSARLAPGRTTQDVWREELERVEARIMSVCRELATTYVDQEEAFTRKEKLKYAKMLEGSVHEAEALKLKLLAAGKTAEEAQAWQQLAAAQLRERWPEDGEKPAAGRRKGKKGGSAAKGESGAAGKGAGAAGGVDGGGGDDDDEEEDDEGESEDGSYDSSFIDDEDAGEPGEEVQGMEAEPDDAAAAGGGGGGGGRSSKAARRAVAGQDDAAEGGADAKEAEEEEEEEEKEAGGEGAPNNVAGLAPNETEVLLGFKARQREKERKKQQRREKQAAREHAAEGPVEETPGAAQQATGGAAAGPAADAPADCGTAVGGGDTRAAEAPEPAPKPKDTLDPASGAAAAAAPEPKVGTDAGDMDVEQGGADRQADADVQMADRRSESTEGTGASSSDGTAAPGDSAEDVQLTQVVESTGKHVPRQGGEVTGGKADAAEASHAAPAGPVLGSEAVLKALYPQSLEVDVPVEVLVSDSGGGAERPACRSMYNAWRGGGRIVEVLGDGKLVVEMKGGDQAAAGPSTSSAGTVVLVELPASSLRPRVDDKLRRQAGEPTLRRGALLQVRETDADGMVIWRPAQVQAVAWAFKSAAAMPWAEMQERLPGRAPVKPQWRRSGDGFKWVRTGGADGAGPSTAAAQPPAAGLAPQAGAAATGADSAGPALQGAQEYGDASYVNSLRGGATHGPEKAEATHVQLLYLDKYVKGKPFKEFVEQVPAEELRGQRGAMPLVWWNPRTGKRRGAWQVVEQDPGLHEFGTRLSNQLMSQRLGKRLTALRKKHWEGYALRRQQELAEGAAAAVAGGAQQGGPQERQAAEQERMRGEEDRLRGKMIQLVARRIARRPFADVPSVLESAGQPRKRKVDWESRYNDSAAGGQGGTRRRKPRGGSVEGGGDGAAGHKRKRGGQGDASKAGRGVTEADGAAAEDSGDGDVVIVSDGEDDESDSEGSAEAAAKGGKGRRSGGSAAAGGASPKRRKQDEAAAARAMAQKQKQWHKQRQEMQKLRHQALAKRQAAGWEVQAGDEGSRCLFEDRPAPKLAACFARRLKEHQIDGLRFMWENLVDNHQLDESRPETESAGGCILAHSMGLGKTLSTITFLHMFLGQGLALSPSQPQAEPGLGAPAPPPADDTDGLAGRRRALLVVPANVLYNFYEEFHLWLPKPDSADEALSRLTSNKVYMLGDDDKVVDEWYSEEGSVLLMSTRKFITKVLMTRGKASAGAASKCAASAPPRGAPDAAAAAAAAPAAGPAAAAAATGAASRAAAEDGGTAAAGRANSGEQPERGSGGGAYGVAAAAADAAPTPAVQARALEIRRMLLEGSGVVVVDEAHELRNPNSQLYKTMCAIGTRRRLALTGYPLQNNLDEYYTMLTWVQGDLLGTQDAFKQEFANVIKKGQQAEATRQERMASNKRLAVLNDITADFIHRAGPEILEKELPPKSEVVLLLDLNDRQREYYEAYLKELDSLTSGSEGHSLFRDFEVLRKVMTHPRDFEALLERAVSGGDMSIIQVEDNDGKEFEFEVRVTPSRPAGGRMKQRMPSPMGGADGGAAAPRRPDSSAEEDNAAAEGAGAGGPKEADKPKKTPLQLPLELCQRLHARIKEQRAALAASEAVSEAGAAAAAGGAPKEEGGVDPLWGSLPKQVFVEKLMRVCHDANEKLAVFSQSLRVLNSLQAMMQRQFGYRLHSEILRIDGAVASQQRQKIINMFNKKEKSRVILVSSKAGSLGTNLTTACRMVIFDVPWNPVFNAQAIARIYRFGQVRPTFVYRLLYAATLEEHVYDLNVDKEELFNKVVDKKLVRKAAWSAGDRWTYTAPPRLDPKAARRRLEDLADASTSAALQLAAGSAGAQRASAGGGPFAAAAGGAAAAAAAGTAGTAGEAVDAKDLALLKLANDPEIQSSLVNAYYHKSKLPPDPLGDLTAEEKMSARQQYQAEVGCDGERRLRRLRRMAPDPVCGGPPDPGAGAAGGSGATQEGGSVPAANDGSMLGRLLSRAGGGGGVARGSSAAAGAGPSEGVDPALEDYTHEEEEQARQRARQRELERQQRAQEEQRRLRKEDKKRKQRELLQQQQQQQQTKQQQQQQNQGDGAVRSSAAAAAVLAGRSFVATQPSSAAMAAGPRAPSAQGAAALRQGPTGPQPAANPRRADAPPGGGGAAAAQGPTWAGAGEPMPNEDLMRQLGLGLISTVIQRTARGSPQAALDNGRTAHEAAALKASRHARRSAPAAHPDPHLAARLAAAGLDPPPYASAQVHAQAPAAAPVPGPASARVAPPLPASLLAPGRKPPGEQPPGPRQPQPVQPHLRDRNPAQNQPAQGRDNQPRRPGPSQQLHAQNAAPAPAQGVMHGIASAPGHVLQRAFVPLGGPEGGAGAPPAAQGQGQGPAAGAAAEAAAPTGAKKRRPEEGRTTEGAGKASKRQHQHQQPHGPQPQSQPQPQPQPHGPQPQPHGPQGAAQQQTTAAVEADRRRGAAHATAAAQPRSPAPSGGVLKSPRPKLQAAKERQQGGSSREAPPPSAGGPTPPAAVAPRAKPPGGSGGPHATDGGKQGGKQGGNGAGTRGSRRGSAARSEAPPEDVIELLDDD